MRAFLKMWLPVALLALGCLDAPVRIDDAGGNPGPGGPGTPPATAVFPLRTEPGKRYLVDAAGRPFFVHGESSWRLIGSLTKAEADQYLEDRRRRGFNTVMVKLMDHEVSSDGRNILGILPFLILGDFSTPNEVYFEHAEYVIRKAAEKGMLVLLAPSYMGYGGGTQGWYLEMTLNGVTKLNGYGRYVATRLRGHNNIVWVNGGDFDPPEKDLARAVANGIRAVDAKWPQTFHGGRGTSALGFFGQGESWLTVNTIYTHADDVVAKAFTEYNRSAMPFFLIEAFYENENGALAATVRQQAYQAVLSGAAGHVTGNNPIWLFGPGWQSALDSPASRTLPHLRALVESRAWHTLVPDLAGTVLTNGVEAGLNQAAAARAVDGSFVLVYAPTPRDMTVNLASLSGRTVVARWYDPTNGAFESIAGSPFAASGSRTFTPPSANAAGDGDWVLVLESSP